MYSSFHTNETALHTQILETCLSETVYMAGIFHSRGGGVKDLPKKNEDDWPA